MTGIPSLAIPLVYKYVHLFLCVYVSACLCESCCQGMEVHVYIYIYTFGLFSFLSSVVSVVVDMVILKLVVYLIYIQTIAQLKLMKERIQSCYYRLQGIHVYLYVRV